MKKVCLILLMVFSVCISASAQKAAGSIKGILQDSASKTPLSEATVSVVRIKDSALISFTLTNTKGFFEIKNLDTGEYDLVSSFQGLQTKRIKFYITHDKQVADIGTVELNPFYNTMDEVVILDNAPVKVKGDTLAFNADAFKTKPNATVEDLLKKLPGVQVNRDGTVNAQGEDVQKVYVDGKEFFGNDPKIATKNLAADMIDEVEIFDDMSEQAKFNQIDDGSRTKAINLKLKKEKKKGVFGKAYAGYGTNERYDAGVNANIFKGAMQTSVIAKSNNTNNVGFTVSDMMGMFGSGGGFGGGGGAIMRIAGRGGSLGGLNLGSTGSGITSSSQVGFNYRDTWSPTIDITGSYFYNQAETENFSTILRQTFSNDTIFFNDQQRNSLSRNHNHRVNLNLVLRIDSMNSIIYTPSLSFQNSRNNSDDTTSFYSLVDNAKDPLNQSRTLNDGRGEGANWSNNIIWRKRFAKSGRTLSVNFSNTLNNNERETYNIFDATLNPRNNYTNTVGNTKSYRSTISYTEPLARNQVLEFNYSYDRNNSESDRQTFDYNSTTGKYDLVDDELTNHFENFNESHRAGTNFRVVEKKYNYQLGVSVQQTLLESNNLTKNTIQSEKFTNIFPTASFNYRFQRSRSFRFNYRGSTRQPSISQLQDVLDVSNTPYLYKGNPSLKQEFSNSFTVGYNHFDIVNFRNLFAFIRLNTTSNKIANSVMINPDGTQLTMPVNLNGAYNLIANVNLGFPIKKMKGGNFNTTTRISLNNNPSLFNGQVNKTQNLNIGEDLRLNYNHKEKLDLGITASINYNMVKYSNPGQFNQDQNYFTHSYSADVSYLFAKGFILSSDFDYTFNTGRTGGYNRSYALWNAGLAKQVFKNKRGEFKISVFDILDQNTSISRDVGDNYIEDISNTTLQRFFSFSFTYHINRMGGKSIPQRMERSKSIRIIK